MDEGFTPTREIRTNCWFCGTLTQTVCECRRRYCAEHGFGGRCLVCGLGIGLFESAFEPETVSGIIMVSLSAASGDPYIVKPPALAETTPLPLANVEKLLGAIIKMLASDDSAARERAASVLAATTNSWPTMDPSALNQNKYGTSLLATDQVRRWLLHVLKQSRNRNQEPIALAILDKLRSADFRDLYPPIADNLRTLTPSTNMARVRSTFEALLDFYPAYSHLANELCEVMVYEQYISRTKGAGPIMERIYGPLLKQSPILARMLKKGTWLSNHARFQEWYFGEEDPA